MSDKEKPGEEIRYGEGTLADLLAILPDGTPLEDFVQTAPNSRLRKILAAVPDLLRDIGEKREAIGSSITFMELLNGKCSTLEAANYALVDKLREAENRIENLKDENRALVKMNDRMTRALITLGLPRGLVGLIAEGD